MKYVTHGEVGADLTEKRPKRRQSEVRNVQNELLRISKKLRNEERLEPWQKQDASKQERTDLPRPKEVGLRVGTCNVLRSL